VLPRGDVDDERQVVDHSVVSPVVGDDVAGLGQWYRVGAEVVTQVQCCHRESLLQVVEQVWRAAGDVRTRLYQHGASLNLFACGKQATSHSRPKMNNQTIKNNPADISDEVKFELKKRLYSYGGASGIRTLHLFHAMEALYQMS
jgi:hypothetical protein